MSQLPLDQIRILGPGIENDSRRERRSHMHTDTQRGVEAFGALVEPDVYQFESVKSLFVFASARCLDGRRRSPCGAPIEQIADPSPCPPEVKHNTKTDSTRC